jgi:2-polyprenyl-3-methyl-5-hydroxy-6-metoxy-1,4-benzoquinol methylase
LDALPLINHVAYGGKNTFQDSFRVLVAGGGTGDAVIYLAEQLRPMLNARVVYADLSQASMEVAKKRARVRKLKNIDWHQMSLLEVATLGQSFDYINCSGVLHHLEDPVAGLKALESVLKPDGAMGIMVYGEYGRAAIYQMQKLLRLLNHEQKTAANKVALSKKVLPLLPETNLFRQQKKWMTELASNGDIGLYDLLLHSTDRAYTVPQIYEWLETAGLVVGRFSGGMGERLKYMPEFLFDQEPELLAHVQKLPIPQQQAIAEAAMSNMIKHAFIATRSMETVAKSTDDDMVPFFYMACAHGPNLAAQMEAKPGEPLNIEVFKGLKVTLRPEAYTTDILRHIDGNKTIGQIIHAVMADRPTAQEQDVRQGFSDLYAKLDMMDALLLRHKSVAAFHTPTQLQQRVVKNKNR